MQTRKRVGVLIGGFSSEREAVARSGEAILAVLRQAGHDAEALFVDRELDLAVRQVRIDTAFLAVRGRYCGDGCLQGLLELLGIPYSGQGVLAASLATNLAKSREVLRLANIPTSPAYVFRADSGRALAEIHGAFGFPVVVRPVSVSTQLAGAVAHDELDLEHAVEEALRWDDEVLVERLVQGQSLQVAVLDGVPLGATATGNATGRGPGLSPPAPPLHRISPARKGSLLRLAASAYEALGCEGAACVEMIVNDRLNEVVVAIDGSPLLSPGAPLPRIAEEAGMAFPELVVRILAGARLRAHGHRQNRRSIQISFAGPERRTSEIGAAH